MSTQKALIIPVKHGNWEIRTVAIPRPGPKDILVKIISAALNPVDWKIHTYDYFGSEYPFVCGSDGAGIVEEVGADVSNVAKGDKIFFQGWFDRERATFQQYAIVPAEITAKGYSCP